MSIVIVHSFFKKNSNPNLLIRFMFYFHIKMCFSNRSIKGGLQLSDGASLRWIK